jgi:hypothetical protein
MTKMPPTNPATIPAVSRDTRHKSPRSRATSRKALSIAGGDLRTAWARRFNDVLDGHVADLGGQDAISEAEFSILRRSATITVELERLEAKFATGEGSGSDLDLYQRASGNLRRLLESVGLQRRAKPVQTLAEYLASRKAAPEAST